MKIDSHNEYISKNFKNMNLSRHLYDSIEFEDCDFINCNFSDSVFTNCKFFNCSFSMCNLSNIKIPECLFSGVNFKECKLLGIDWTRGHLSKINLKSPYQFRKCILDDSSFFGLKLNQIIMDECQAKNVDFRQGHFVKGYFCKTDFAQALFSETNLSQSNFTQATNFNIDIKNNTIKKAKFSRFEALNLLNGLDIELID